jgi:CubicO group peptidase (beta-lactamase class C family)
VSPRRAARRAAPPVGGRTADGFDAVRREVWRNFDARGELGFACAAVRRGEVLVDLWGGWRDRARRLPWEEDTLVTVFSTTKGVTALALALLVSRGRLELDAPVASLWPEFAAAGKERVTVRDLLAHRAGLIEVDEPIDFALLADPDRLAGVLARQRPAWPPGHRHGYHTLTFGLYAAELVRRADPEHRTAGTFVREELARPLGAEFHIGLPEGVDERRVAEVDVFSAARVLLVPGRLPVGMFLRMPFSRSLSRRAMSNPRMRGPGALAQPAWRRVELASGNGIGDARSIARMYAAFAAPGGPLGLEEHVFAELTAPPEPARDAVLHAESAYSLGFVRPTRAFAFGTSPRAFGMAGAGGSFGFADADTGIGFAYVTNRMGTHLFDDPRELALRRAVLAAASARELA